MCDLIVWNDSFSVNFGPIDEQHKGLVVMTNELLMACGEGGSTTDHAFMKAVRGAVEYARTHFYTEEKYMKEVNYPDLPAHKKEHENFIAQVLNSIKSFEAGGTEPLALACFLKNWILNHIAVSDMKYAPYLSGIGAGAEKKGAQGGADLFAFE
ncbi:MAG: bacteriohemerythrin [Treponema sp.]|jgi:hemerythrin|nr:bacteriohemerythrin [Treponema sp.]